MLVKIDGKGSIKIICKNEEARELHGVYCIPTLWSNIISLVQLSEEGNRVILNGENLWVYDRCGKLLMQVKRSGNRLYKVHIKEAQQQCLLTNREEEAWLWHHRLGHINFKVMHLMSKNNMAHGLPVLVQPNENCSGCIMSKQTRKPFPSQTIFSAKHALELIHVDLCGLITPSTPVGNRFFMLLVDDYTRMMWVYMLKHKSESMNYFKKFKSLVENEAKLSIQVLRSDRGGEFCSKEFNLFCEEQGIS